MVGRRETRDAFQNREEHPATRKRRRGLLFALERGKKRTTFLAGNQVERAPGTSSFSLSLLFWLIYVPIYLLSYIRCSILQCTVGVVPIEERDTRVNKIDINEPIKRQIFNYNFQSISV